ncbi:MAG: hypothetical protein P1P69_00890 [Methanosarcinaceae archaeon]|nr:hypothetical protein [Methanosarcinaceae archaeon]MDF1533046.1 hypothetical protein [Methanosarcinaceae archaeon]
MAEKIDEAKLVHLVEHWIEHNESHSKSFRDWAVKIESAGFSDAAKTILVAAEKMDESSEYLKKAKK